MTGRTEDTSGWPASRAAMSARTEESRVAISSFACGYTAPQHCHSGISHSEKPSFSAAPSGSVQLRALCPERAAGEIAVIHCVSLPSDHVLRVEHLVEALRRQKPRLTQASLRRCFPYRLFCRLRRVFIADVRVQCRDEHKELCRLCSIFSRFARMPQAQRSLNETMDSASSRADCRKL